MLFRRRGWPNAAGSEAGRGRPGLRLNGVDFVAIGQQYYAGLANQWFCRS
jgi:hypothetical protein